MSYQTGTGNGLGKHLPGLARKAPEDGSPLSDYELFIPGNRGLWRRHRRQVERPENSSSYQLEGSQGRRAKGRALELVGLEGHPRTHG